MSRRLALAEIFGVAVEYSRCREASGAYRTNYELEITDHNMQRPLEACIRFGCQCVYVDQTSLDAIATAINQAAAGWKASSCNPLNRLQTFRVRNDQGAVVAAFSAPAGSSFSIS